MKQYNCTGSTCIVLVELKTIVPSCAWVLLACYKAID